MSPGRRVLEQGLASKSQFNNALFEPHVCGHVLNLVNTFDYVVVKNSYIFCHAGHWSVFE